ncbi:MAG: NifU family protein [Chloroflexota bacterium]|nr:NifU family protein [Chloroflexota bacterium]
MTKISVEAVEEVLDEIRPAIQLDGGNVELLEITKDGVVRLAMVGACGGCPMSTLTLKAGIERLLVERIPEIAGVEAIGEGGPIDEWEAGWGSER